MSFEFKTKQQLHTIKYVIETVVSLGLLPL